VEAKCVLTVISVNGNICKKSSTLVSPADILTFSRADQILIAKIISTATRRGPASEAQMLYQDLTPAQEIQKKNQRDLTAPRYKGAGRPTKNERRAIDKLMNRD